MRKNLISILALLFVITFTSYTGYAKDLTVEELLRKVEALEKKAQKTEALEARVAELERKLASQPAAKPEAEARIKKVTLKKEAEKGKGVVWDVDIPGVGDVIVVQKTITANQIGKLKVYEGFEFKPPMKDGKAPFLSIHPYATIILQGTPRANRTDQSEFNGCYKADVDIEKEFGDYGLAFINFEMGGADTIMSQLDLFSNVNNNANDTGANVTLNKVWYQQYLFDKQMRLLAGKLDPTDWFQKNKYEDTDSMQFLTKMFNNSPTIEWPPGKIFGAHTYMCFKEADFIEARINFFEADGDWKNVLDNGMYVGEIAIKPDVLLKLDHEQWGGDYRFYGWVNTRNHAKLVDEGDAPSTAKEANFGFGISFNQALTDIYGMFCRFGWQRPDLIPAPGGPTDATFEWSWSAGAQMIGKYWGRDKDVVAFAVGQIVPSREYKDAGNPASAEGHIETYYRCQLNEHLGITPAVQLIWNPDGVSDGNVIFVYGGRAYINF